MPVVGIDLGSYRIKISSIIGGKVVQLKDSVLDNTFSPWIIFKKGMRYYGNEAVSQSRNDFSTIVKFNKKNFARIINLSDNKEFMDQITLKANEEKQGMFEVKHGNEVYLIDSIDIAFMIFRYCLNVTKTNFESASNFDCTINCPGYFSMEQRRGLICCASAAGFQNVRVVNETVLAGLYYSMFDFKQTEDSDHQNVVIVDFGYSGMQLSMCEVKMNYVKEVAYSFLNVGLDAFNKNVTDLIFQKYITQEENMNLSPIKQKELYAFIHSKVDKLKESILLGIDIKFNCDYQGNYVDVHLAHDELKEKNDAIIGKVLQFIDEFASSEKVKGKKIHSIVPCGNGTRIGEISAHLMKTFGCDIYLRTDCDVLVTYGATICAALHSSSMRVNKEAKIMSSLIVPIEMSWPSEEGKRTSIEIFKSGDNFPSSKIVTIKCRSSEMDISFKYKTQHPFQENVDLANVNLTNIKIPEDSQVLVLKASISLDLSGILKIDSITFERKREFKTQEEVTDDEDQQEENVENDNNAEKISVADENSNVDKKDEVDGKEKGEAGIPENNSQKNDNDNNKEKKEKENKTVKRKTKLVDKIITRNVKEDLKFNFCFNCSSKINVDEILKNEKTINKVDESTFKKQMSREEMFKIYSRCCSILDSEVEREFVEDVEELQKISDDAEDQSSTLIQRIDLEKITKTLEDYYKVLNPIEHRIREFNDRFAIVEDYRKSLEYGKSCVKNMVDNRDQYKHIEDSEIEHVVQTIGFYEEWLNSTLNKISEAPKCQEAPHSNSEIVGGKTALLEKIMPIINKPIPAAEKLPASAASTEDNANSDNNLNNSKNNSEDEKNGVNADNNNNDDDEKKKRIENDEELNAEVNGTVENSI